MQSLCAPGHALVGLVLAGLILSLNACAPTRIPPGPTVTEPRLDDSAFVTTDGAKLPVRTWQPVFAEPEAVLIALHGFNDYGRFFETPAYFLADAGILSYAYDQRGFGEAPHRGFWPGVETLADDLAAFVRLVRRRHPNLPVYVIGASMGGAVALVTMTRANPPPVDGVILSAPAVWGRATMPWYQRLALAVASHTVPWLTLTGRGLNKVPSDNIDMLRGLSRDPLVIKETRVDTIYGLVNLMDAAYAAAADFDAPALILYGEKDEIIPAEPTYRTFDKIRRHANPKQTIAVYPGGYHMLLRDLQSHVVLGDIAAWIKNAQAPLPSGADKNARRITAAE